ncbi:Electron transfer flavoprotein alpha subunit [Cellulomonas flavigena DSM 20109]|uniref:Electron transfer flavoprotein alpha subunit n=1 Tax=Cellulomonas flavigena (strain ATCC 482 / DSM 20109 / BCRC 11376 / JCM 18109 / NBRC 3775 / NCIMB 8073 / NRS 134) TaxID=446466 RepID=D5UE73_CELFN|nr:electron transfer flavoprotein subunit alpha/FixB family protein [Cellulomonas flavigena]ADG76549.1 Electron transfer flavoprotein alpha subunit [Cellulomonas flavigena DSM 20109]
MALNDRTHAGPVLVLVDHRDGVVAGPTLELLTVARSLGRVHALWRGAAPDGRAIRSLGEYGAEVVHHIAAVDPDAELSAVLAHDLVDVAESGAVSTVLLSSTAQHKEAAARAAFVLGSGLVVDAVGVRHEQDARVEATVHAFAATWAVRIDVGHPRAVITLRPGAVAPDAVQEALFPEVRPRRPENSVDLRGVRVLERIAHPSSYGPDLASARVVVAGGRGTDGDFSALRELAVALGGAVGSTRVATDEGWIGTETQIGQTGVAVAPALYIGAGISGAVHHRSGMQSAGTIVAINTDPEAPIFELADFGVVGDLFTVLPQLTAELRRLRT